MLPSLDSSFMNKVRPYIRLNRFPNLGLLWLIAMVMLGSLQGADLAYTPAPANNPLKGFVSGYHNDRNFSKSLTPFRISLRSLMTSENTFEWKDLERHLQISADRGFHAIIRVYLDWPDAPLQLPQFLMDAGIKRHQFSTNAIYNRAENWSPDYEDPLLRSALTNFIAAFGAKYNGDPRIGFIEAGLIGSWGEWVIWGGKKEWQPSLEVQQLIIDAYERAFTKTKVLLRWPSEYSLSRKFGYHDDWFGHRLGNYRNEYQKLGVTAPEQWKKQVMGGRVHPEFDRCLWETAHCGPSEAEFQKLIEEGHYTYLNLRTSYDAITPSATPRALKWAQRLGYELHAQSVTLKSDHILATLDVSVTLTNTGVAPFYYPWPVELAAAQDGNIIASAETDWNLTRVIPGQTAKPFNYTIRQTGFPSGDYQLLLRVVNPLTNGISLRFANQTQDQTVSGWLTLGDFTVE